MDIELLFNCDYTCVLGHWSMKFSRLYNCCQWSSLSYANRKSFVNRLSSHNRELKRSALQQNLKDQGWFIWSCFVWTCSLPWSYSQVLNVWIIFFYMKGSVVYDFKTWTNWKWLGKYCPFHMEHLGLKVPDRNQPIPCFWILRRSAAKTFGKWFRRGFCGFQVTLSQETP